MTNHELNAQVAEFMGWTHACPRTGCGYPPDSSVSPEDRILISWPGRWGTDRFPDYSGSLDAAWQMEEEIERRGELTMSDYTDELAQIVGDSPPDEPFICSYDPWPLVHATPTQRCEAVLAVVRTEAQETERERLRDRGEKTRGDDE